MKRSLPGNLPQFRHKVEEHRAYHRGVHCAERTTAASLVFWGTDSPGRDRAVIPHFRSEFTLPGRVGRGVRNVLGLLTNLTASRRGNDGIRPAGHSCRGRLARPRAPAATPER